ncbi:MAG: dihydrolipoyllysine-residue acetyltransferase [Burkholderiales bacterium]|jgi:pyruvate dehydrogenase E2 component (dihydrolipoamide acetyltransferase)|nr:Dihydrolipoyllysine-residue acetyltransferase component of pyruvate dehydrogenase complex [Betaproteobacteria bacterium MOLA814]
MSLIQVSVPDIGDFDEVSVIEMLVAVGDTVEKDQSLITVESDKASIEIPSSHAGVVKSISVKLGDKVKQGVVVLELDSAAAGESAPTAGASDPAPNQQAASAPASPHAAVSVSSASTNVEMRIPDIGDFKDVAVIEILVHVGDTVAAEQSLITVESDKASVEIPASHAGVLQSLSVKLGDIVNIGDLIAVVAGSAPAASAAALSPAPAPAQVQAVSTPTTPVPDAPRSVAVPSTSTVIPAHNPTVAPSGHQPYASPSVRKFARQLGVPLEQLKGTGHKSRITQEDVYNFTKEVMAGHAQTQAQVVKGGSGSGAGGEALGLLPWPVVDFAKFGPVERRDMSRIKKIAAANLHRNWVLIPHVTNHDDADITDLEAFRLLTNKENEKAGVKVTMLAFLIKACVAALKKFPDFNSSLDGEQLVMKQYFHIGFAADTPNGLVVPVIKDADKKGVMQISAEMSELAKKAREGKLGPADMTGACFTISSLGGIGGRYFTPIINAPEVAILGVCRSNMEPVWNGKEFEPRLMLPLSLSWDHRVIDGASAARFNAYLGQIMADFRRILL